MSRFSSISLPRFSNGMPSGVELALVPARCHAHEHAAVRELVHGGELLGQRHGIAKRQHQNAGAELDLASCARQSWSEWSANR